MLEANETKVLRKIVGKTKIDTIANHSKGRLLRPGDRRNFDTEQDLPTMS